MNAREALQDLLIILEETSLQLQISPKDQLKLQKAGEVFGQIRTIGQLVNLNKGSQALYVSEMLFAALKSGSLQMNEQTLDLLLASIELNRQVFDFYNPPKTPLKPISGQNQSASTSPTKTATEEVSITKTIKVDSDHLDDITEAFQELVMRYSIIAQQGRDESVLELGKIIDELNRKMEGLCMVSLKPMFLRMKRLVADAAQKTGKEILYIMEGENHRLDKRIVEELSEPLVHLLRNACDHGIESTQERIAKGKPPVGNVLLKAWKEGDFAVIQVKENGRGLDPQKILNKAVQKGIAKPATQYTEQQIFRFIFHPGFSTAEQVSDLSGRGVGMNVVLKKIKSLGGEIKIQSKKDMGTLFTLKIPLKNTLSGIFNGVVSQVGHFRCSMPVQFVREVLDWKIAQRKLLQNKSFPYQEGYLKVLEMRQLFRLPPGRCQDAIILETDAKERCLLIVDRVLGEQQIVSRKFDNYMSQVSNKSLIYGMGFTGEEITLVLDSEKLVRL